MEKWETIFAWGGELIQTGPNHVGTMDVITKNVVQESDIIGLFLDDKFVGESDVYEVGNTFLVNGDGERLEKYFDTNSWGLQIRMSDYKASIAIKNESLLKEYHVIELKKLIK